ncbi:MAG TPA: ATP-binding protein [Albitalea sp.]|uniref:ATP-binding response regulator n=1 Tax=Piscinibacter sp. TaxID=1903157 RepID=UPI002ED4975A
MPIGRFPRKMLGALVAPAPAAAPAADTLPGDATLPEEVRSVYDYMPATLLGYLAGIGVICMLFWADTPTSVWLPWGGAFAAMWIGRFIVWRRFRGADPQSHAEWLRWRLYWNAGTLASAALWGASAWIFYFRGESIQQIGLIVTVYTFCAAAVPVLATQPRVFLAYAALCFVPMAARIASEGTVQSYQLAGILFLIFGLTTVLARNYRQALQRALELKVHADELLAQLRVEKQAADAARYEAEVANRAKTQFFTAASHDLRQPLHAMGLFAEALRQKSHDDEVAQLVNSINGSVDALEGLFSELLDITRIDSGGVAVNPQPFEIDAILRKLRLHFEPTAFEKGLALRMRGARHVAHADPLLVERIVRNLVSNAIRYTNDGSVLVSCRRRGDKLLLQVWDTGVGIPEHELSRIFEEFYQVPGSGVVAPQQRKGLGLGLAIVKRLAELMGAPLTLRSQPGRGTVFSLELPVGKAVKTAVPVASGKGPLGLTLDGRLIVVVEDEPAVRGGLDALLRGWGATLASFDSVAASNAWAAQSDPSTVKPDLLIVDYRLENGLNGVDAIQSLRERFGPRIPAIVVTGSTMSGLDAEAQEKDFHLLIKPVVPNKLRAMIAFKLGTKPAS